MKSVRSIIAIAIFATLLTACSTIDRFEHTTVHSSVLGLKTKNNQVVSVSATRVTRPNLANGSQEVRVGGTIFLIGLEENIPGYTHIQAGQKVILRGTLSIEQDYNRKRNGEIIIMANKKPSTKTVYTLKKHTTNQKLISLFFKIISS